RCLRSPLPGDDVAHRCPVCLRHPQVRWIPPDREEPSQETWDASSIAPTRSHSPRLPDRSARSSSGPDTGHRPERLGQAPSAFAALATSPSATKITVANFPPIPNASVASMLMPALASFSSTLWWLPILSASSSQNAASVLGVFLSLVSACFARSTSAVKK